MTHTLDPRSEVLARTHPYVEETLVELKRYIDEKINGAVKEMVEEVSSSIVGESYYRYDSSSTYFPTLVMIFREEGASSYKRRAQVKARLKYSNSSLTDSAIEEIREKCNRLDGLQFEYGTVRGNYVSSDKKWKTTVFGKDEESIVHLLDTVCTCVDEPFSKSNLSITIGRARKNITKRTEPLQGVGVNGVDYQVNITMKLYRVCVLVNGLQRPIPVVRFTSGKYGGA